MGRQVGNLEMSPLTLDPSHNPLGETMPPRKNDVYLVFPCFALYRTVSACAVPAVPARMTMHRHPRCSPTNCRHTITPFETRIKIAIYLAGERGVNQTRDRARLGFFAKTEEGRDEGRATRAFSRT